MRFEHSCVTMSVCDRVSVSSDKVLQIQDALCVTQTACVHGKSNVPQAWSFLSHLPVLEVEMSMKGWWEESQEQTERPIPAAGANLRKGSSWLDVHADQEYVLQVSLRRLNLGQQRVSIHNIV